MDRISQIWQSAAKIYHPSEFVKYLFLLTIGLLTACNQTGMSHLDDRDLRHRHHQCRMAVDASPAEIQVCKNIKRECENRQDTGNYAC